MLQRVDLARRDRARGRARGLTVEGFEEDTLVHAALTALATRPASRRAGGSRSTSGSRSLRGSAVEAPTPPRRFAWRTRRFREPLAAERLHELAAGLGADVPFFLTRRPAARDVAAARTLSPLDLPRDYDVLLVLPTRRCEGVDRGGLRRVRPRRRVRGPANRRYSPPSKHRDLAALPANDLASSPLAHELRAAGAFRADVSGAGPMVYGLFADRDRAEPSPRVS